MQAAHINTLQSFEGLISTTVVAFQKTNLRFQCGVNC